MSDLFNVVCGKCQVGAQAVSKDDREAYAVCPSCGQRDKLEDAQRIAEEHLVEGTKAALDLTLSKVARGSKIMKYTSGPPKRPDSDFRWHAVSA